MVSKCRSWGTRLKSRACVHCPERLVAACYQDHVTAITYDLENELWEKVAVTLRGRTATEWRLKDLTPDEHKQIIEILKSR